MPKISPKTNWNLAPLFKNDNDPAMAKEREIVEKESYKFINKWKNRADYLKDPKALKEALDEFERWEKNWGAAGREGFYFGLRQAQDQNSPKLKAKASQINDFAHRIGNDIRFFTLNLSKIPAADQQKFLAEPQLAAYHHFLERLFVEGKYILSEKEENILALKAKTSYSDWVDMREGFLAKEERELKIGGKKIKKSFSEIVALASNENKAVRDQAAAAFNDVLKKYEDVAEAELNAVLSHKKINDDLRKLTRPDLLRHINDDIDSSTVDTLIAAVASQNKIAQKYYALKAKLLGVKKMAYHERNVPYGKLNKNYSYEEAVAVVREVLGALDKQFLDIFDRYLAAGQIDVFPQKGKTSGAFCSTGLPITPTFILLNFAGKLNDIGTIAHEMGHGIHSELMRRQNALNIGTPTSVAEVASNFVESFVADEIEKQLPAKEKLAIKMLRLNDDVTSIFRQIAAYRFEQELHKKYRELGYIAKEEIGKLFQKHMSAYMGPAVLQSPGSENWWIYWSHLRNYFYNYSYASGQLIAKYLQGQTKKDPAFIGKVKEFLSTGTADSPKNIFAKMGIDIDDKNFWLTGLKEIEKELKEAEKLARQK